MTQIHISQHCCPCDDHVHVTQVGHEYLCDHPTCIHSKASRGFEIHQGTPVFISPERTDTVCQPHQLSSYVQRSRLKSLLSSIQRCRADPITRENCERFCQYLRDLTPQPKVLVIGAGSRGHGTEKLWDDDAIEKHGIDIYLADTVDTVCDAHYLPFAPDAFDGVWIQAVLEHVVEPTRVVNEIYRVLRPKGMVYSETPFLQQVHEGAYDFTRYTILGHRYLFKKFEEVTIGPIGAPDLVLAWSIGTFVAGMTRLDILGKVTLELTALVLRPLRLLFSRKAVKEGCSGTFFQGIKAVNPNISHRDLVERYARI